MRTFKFKKGAYIVNRDYFSEQKIDSYKYELYICKNKNDVKKQYDKERKEFNKKNIADYQCVYDAKMVYFKALFEAEGEEWMKKDSYKEFYKKNDIHIHFPEGATPKDGPSAGVTMTTALVSALSGIPVRREVAMTGEISLRGRVLRIGGLKEKLLAANMAGIKRVLIPEENRKDLAELSAEIIGDMDVRPVSHMSEVLKFAFV